MHIVSGNSMYPLIRPGQTLIVNRYAYLFSLPDVDDVLVFRHPDSGELLVKRVSAIADGPMYHVRGVNLPESLDSRHFGGLTPEVIIGRVEFLGRYGTR